MSVHEGHRERMRRQMKTSGMDSLSDVQVLEVALYYAIARRDTNEIAHALLRRFGSLSGVLEAPRAELLKIDGVGESAADLLLLFIQMERRHLMDRAGRETILDTTYKCAQYLMPRFIGEQEEVVYLLCLDAKCKALDCSLIHRGAVNMTAISVRKIVKARSITTRPPWSWRTTTRAGWRCRAARTARPRSRSRPRWTRSMWCWWTM